MTERQEYKIAKRASVINEEKFFLEQAKANFQIRMIVFGFPLLLLVTAFLLALLLYVASIISIQ